MAFDNTIKEYLVELFSNMKETDLISLVSTITHGKISATSKQEAIESIMLHSDNVASVLKRKKVTKDFLFHYLHAKKVAVLVSDEKPKLIQYILKLWNIKCSESDNDIKLPLQSPNISSLTQNLPRSPLYSDSKQSHNSDQSINIRLEHNIVNGPGMSSVACNISMPSSPENSVNITTSAATIMCNSSNSSSSGQSNEIMTLDENLVNTLSLKFTEWFYSVLNKNFRGGCIAINSQHFWNDAELAVKLKSLNPGCSLENIEVIEEETAQGIQEIIGLFNKIKDRHQLYFSPNLRINEGVKGRPCKNGSGGVIILACGTLHKDIAQMVGTFEQIFLIFQDPLTDDTWKIKKTELHLISISNVPQPQSEIPHLYPNSPPGVLALQRNYHCNNMFIPTINNTSLKSYLS